jgi:hypothetical protein
MPKPGGIALLRVEGMKGPEAAEEDSKQRSVDA